MSAASVLLASETSGGGSGFGLVVVLAIIGVLGWVVARSMQRQRDYERRLRDHPDGIHGRRPEPPEPDDD
ncbi:MAG TPA: type II secretion system protein [Egicoccus sp.]|nr:type II secretion system protein [Egicoccus sp.]HSK22332.1 type II secretion system protein [Egicoccus sp.]